MAVDVVVVNYNSGKYLADCLESVYKTAGKIEKRVVVFDNNSKDNSVELAQKSYPEVEYIKNKTNIGFAAAVNRVLFMTGHEYVLLVNQDMIVLPGGIKAMIDFMSDNPGCGVLGGEILKREGSRQLTCRRFPGYGNILFGRRSIFSKLLPGNPISSTYQYFDLDYSRQQKVDFLEGSLLMLRRKALNEVGFFDNNFFLYLEDADISYRMKKEGWETWWLPRAYAIHFRGENVREDNIHPMIYHSKGFYTFFVKHYNPGIVMKSLMKILLIIRIGYLLATESAKIHLR